MTLRLKRFLIELLLLWLALKHLAWPADRRLQAARRDALLYAAEGRSAWRSVSLAEVHAFRVHGLARRRAG